MKKPHQLNLQTPTRQSRRIRNLEPETPKNVNEPPPIPKIQQIKRQKSIPPPTPPSSPLLSPTTPVTAANFKSAYEDINNPLSLKSVVMNKKVMLNCNQTIIFRHHKDELIGTLQSIFLLLDREHWRISWKFSD